MLIRFTSKIKTYVLATSLVLLSSSAAVAEDDWVEHFSQNTPDSSLKMNFDPVDMVLNSYVLKMGDSTRSFNKRAHKATGTKMQTRVDRKTGLEGNRFAFEVLKQNPDKKAFISKIRAYLQGLPVTTPLKNYTQEEQLAYWLNLYNITLLDELVKQYPVRRLESRMIGEESILNTTVVIVDGFQLTLAAIQNMILPTLFKEPLTIYGMYQGYIGSPSILDEAFRGKTVYKQLEQNARNFINSNRGTYVEDEETVRVSSFYKRNAAFFPNFDDDLKAHLTKYANDDIKPNLIAATHLQPTINNWTITDIWGTIRDFSSSLNTNPAALLSSDGGANIIETFVVKNRGQFGGLSTQQIDMLKKVLRTRAKNFGGGTVTVTDTEDIEETEEEK